MPGLRSVLKQAVHDGTPEIEIAEQRQIACQLRFRQRQIGGRQDLPSAGDGLVTTTVWIGCRLCM